MTTEDIYFSKIEFQKYMSVSKALIFCMVLDLDQRELSYQEYGIKQRRASDDDNRIILSHGIRLTDEDMERILPYCRVKEFEPYRSDNRFLDSSQYISESEAAMNFKGITDSHIPMIKIAMSSFHTKNRRYPNERLFEFLVKNYIKTVRKLKNSIAATEYK